MEDGNLGNEQTSEASDVGAEQENASEAEKQEGAEQEEETVDEIVAKAVAKATAKYEVENKKLTKALEKLRNEKLTADELKKLQEKEREEDLSQRENELKLEKNRMYAVSALKESGLDDGSKESLEAIDFIMADDEEGIKKRAQGFKKLVDKLVAAKVNEKFKDSGRNPQAGAGSAGKQVNPIAQRLGKISAETQKQSRSVLDMYIGGNRK